MTQLERTRASVVMNINGPALGVWLCFSGFGGAVAARECGSGVGAGRALRLRPCRRQGAAFVAQLDPVTDGQGLFVVEVNVMMVGHRACAGPG